MHCLDADAGQCTKRAEKESELSISISVIKSTLRKETEKKKKEYERWRAPSERRP